MAEGSDTWKGSFKEEEANETRCSLKLGAFDSHFHFLRFLLLETPLDLEVPERLQKLTTPCGARETKNFGRDVPAAAVKSPNFP